VPGIFAGSRILCRLDASAFLGAGLAPPEEALDSLRRQL